MSKRTVSVLASAGLVGGILVLSPVAQAGTSWSKPQDVNNTYGRKVAMSDNGRGAAAVAQAAGVRWTPPSAYSGTISDQYSGWTAHVRFAIDPYEAGSLTGTRYSVHYNLAVGWPLEVHRVVWTPGSCVANPPSVDVVLHGGTGTLYFDGAEGKYEYWFEVWGPETEVPVTITCPDGNGGTYSEVQLERVGFHLLQYGSAGQLSSPGGRPPGWLRGTDFNDTYWDLTAEEVEPPGCPKKNVRTGPGYKDMDPGMKKAVSRLYANLDAADACYRFVIGWRPQQYQDRLRDRWHDIADKAKGDKRTNRQICKALKKAHFAQCPKGHLPPNGKGARVAKGGPAKVSRHTAGQAADIAVTFPPDFMPDISRYKKAARGAGLCGPPTHDPPHVELPHKRNKVTKQLVCSAWSRG